MRGNGYGAKKERTKNEENQTWNKETKQIIPDHKDASSGSELEKREMISKAASLKDRGREKNTYRLSILLSFLPSAGQGA